MAVTWSATNKDTRVTLSGGGLVATSDGSAGTPAESGRTDTAISGTSTVYLEIVETQADTNQYTQVGFGNSSMAISGSLGFDANLSIGFYHSGAVFLNSAQIATIQGWTPGQVLGFAINFARGLIWMRTGGGNWNNDVLANQNPATNTGGISFAAVSGGIFPAYTMVGDPTQPAIITARFTAASFANAAPSGYSAYDTGSPVHVAIGAASSISAQAVAIRRSGLSVSALSALVAAGAIAGNPWTKITPVSNSWSPYTPSGDTWTRNGTVPPSNWTKS